jgi:hypothetical protein
MRRNPAVSLVAGAMSRNPFTSRTPDLPLCSSKLRDFSRNPSPGGEMLDFENLRVFMEGMKDAGKTSIQDSMGNIAVISHDCPRIDGLLERAIWFRIGDGEWMARGDFEKIVVEWRERGRKEFKNS